MKTYELYVGEDEGERLDVFLSKELDEVSRTYIQKLIKEKLVFVNNKTRKSSHLVEEGDHIIVKFPKPKVLQVLAEDIPLDIVYEDNDLVVVNKPQGLVVHPAPGNYTGTLVNGLLFHIDKLSSINGIIRPGIVHRLDKDTSGLLIVAKSDKAHRILSELLKNKEINRTYLALVHGLIKQNEDTINLPIGRSSADRKKMAVTYKNSKEAITDYKVLSRYDNYSLIEVSLKTGRTHQIRVHMAHINHPIVGDPVYSRRKNEFGLDKQMLHAYKLGFLHPVSKDYLEFEIELPRYFKDILENIQNRRK
ncbi:MAG: RluA family pseudouridine synthase [Tissierellaceae bacterium]|nr:RluA family pseudouridine synthase [Tissierellaceae bacterium]